MRRWLLGLVVVAAMARPVVAGGAFLWDVPAGCPDQGALRSRVDEHLGRPLGERDQLAARVVISGEPGAFHAVLSIVIGRRVVEREVTGQDCDAVTSAVALVLAMLVREAAEPAPPARSAPVVAPRVRVDAPPVLVAPARAGPSPWLASARVALLGEGGALPGAGAGAGAAIALGWRNWRAELHGSAWLSRRARIDGFGSGAEMELVVGGLRACGVRGERMLCAQADVGLLEGRGVGVDSPGQASRRWSATGLAVATGFRLGAHIDAVAMAEGLVALDRPRFVLDDGTLVYRPAPVVVRLSIAVQLGTKP